MVPKVPSLQLAKTEVLTPYTLHLHLHFQPRIENFFAYSILRAALFSAASPAERLRSAGSLAMINILYKQKVKSQRIKRVSKGTWNSKLTRGEFVARVIVWGYLLVKKNWCQSRKHQARIQGRWNGWIFTPPPFFWAPFFLFFFSSLKYWNNILLHYYKNSPPISKSWICACTHALYRDNGPLNIPADLRTHCTWQSSGESYWKHWERDIEERQTYTCIGNRYMYMYVHVCWTDFPLL